jgi:phosphatidylglycerol:prolipoprotein diacylglycerol transferase
MLATIPYFQVPTLTLGPLTLDSWATLVALGFIAGLELVRARGIRLGLDVRDVVDGLLVTVGLGFVGGHLMHVLAYNPQQLQEQGIMALIKVWGGFSSTGGFLGAVVGGVLFYTLIRPRPFWIHADNMMWGFPFAWTAGRTGCFTAHDHIGSLSEGPLAVAFTPEFYRLRYGSGLDAALMGPRHDLGLYEALWTALIAGAFWALRKRDLRPGFFMALWCAMYAPFRFVLDFLRNGDLPGADVRWSGLTPAQWIMLAMTATGLWLVWKLRQPLPAAPAEAPPAP